MRGVRRKECMAELTDAAKYRFDGENKLSIRAMDTDGNVDKADRIRIEADTKVMQQKIRALQDRLYADGREGVIVILQAMDAAGKDSTVKHVMSGVNPQGVEVHSFKTPSADELAHDYLWRVNKCIPARGMIAIFNRSYYEDVLVARLRELNKTYKMPERCISKSTEEFYKERYEDIRNYEKYLFHNGYRIVKIFLNVSKKEQKKRFLERIEESSKNWKFNPGDLDDRAAWDRYHEIYEDAVNATASAIAPWYVLPADKKWYTHYLVSEILLKTLETIDPKYPKLDENARIEMDKCRKILEREGKKDKNKDKDGYKDSLPEEEKSRLKAEKKAKKAAKEESGEKAGEETEQEE